MGDEMGWQKHPGLNGDPHALWLRLVKPRSEKPLIHMYTA